MDRRIIIALVVLAVLMVVGLGILLPVGLTKWRSSGSQRNPAPGTPSTIQIGSWREVVIDSNGKVDVAEYRRIANTYETPSTLDYRLGPTASDFGNDTADADLGTVSGPSSQGLWPFGTQPPSDPGEPSKCVLSQDLPKSEAEELARGMNGAGWIIGGQYLFLPDPVAQLPDADFRFGMSNIRTADGNVFNTGGLCMRQRASWEADWWNRNEVSTPATPEVAAASVNSSLPLPAVAIARAKGNCGQIAYAAFRNGMIVPMKVGNSAPEFYSREALQLPAGLVPTAMVVSAYNEFLFVTVWDTNDTPTGRLAVIALRPREMAVGDPGQTPNTRWYWGLPGAWTNLGMKLLGLIQLPFATPHSVDVYSNVIFGNPRGFNDNDDPAVGDLSQQSARDTWFNVPSNGPWGNDNWRQHAQYGYAIVSSRAENKTSFIDLRPLYQYYRKMYMTTQSRYDETTKSDWPHTFSQRPEQVPTVALTISVPQPTAVRTGQLTNTPFGLTRTDWFVENQIYNDRLYAARRAYIGLVSGTVLIYDVTQLIQPNSSQPITQIGQFYGGRNPVSFAETGPLATAPDDLFVISRGDRSIAFVFPDGSVQGRLSDSRLEDPVGATVGLNQAGYGGSGAGRAVFAVIITVCDYNGKALTDYAVETRRSTPPAAEQYPFNGALFLYGWKQPTPGKAIAATQIEII